MQRLVNEVQYCRFSLGGFENEVRALELKENNK